MDELIAQGLAYMRATWRRRWYALLIAWVIAIVGWGWVYSLPNVYKASARVYVDTKSLLDPLLRGLTVEPNVEQRVDMVTRTLLSRPNLQEVARRSDLDLSAKTPAKMQALVDDLGKSISLQGGNRDNIYTISYEYKKPAVARKVVQSLLNIFMETSVGGTREDIDSSQQFIDKQLQAYKQKLDAQEEKIKNFKQNNYGLLPGQGGDYFDRLQQAKSDLDQARLQLKEAENRKSVLEARLNGKQPVLLGSPNSSSSQSDSTGELDARIAKLQAQLDQLRMRYTDNHPDVKSTQRMIADLKKQRAAQQKAMGVGDNLGQSADAFREQLSVSVAQAESDVASLNARVSAYEQRYKDLKAQVDEIPAIEQRYKALTRDQAILKKNYEELLSRRDKAQMSSSVQAETKPIDFRVVDPPFVPTKPSGPNRVLLATGVLLAALAAGLGVAFLLGQLRRVVDSRQMLAALSRRPFLGTVSMHESAQQVRRRRMKLATFAVSAAALFAVYGVIAGYYLQQALTAA